MWLSKMLSKSDKTMTAESGSVTLSDKNTCEIGASVCQRDIDSYSPYGYSSRVPRGEKIILVPSADGQVMLGTAEDSSSLESGEIRIASAGGAKIILKNDGTVIINSMIIGKDGVIKNDK